MVFEKDVAHHGDEPVVVFVEPLRLLIFPERAAVSFFGRHKALKVRTRSLPEFANKFMLEIFRLKNQLTKRNCKILEDNYREISVQSIFRKSLIRKFYRI